MPTSKNKLLIFGNIFLLAAISLLLSIFMQWNSLMETNRERLFFRIIFFVLSAYKAIDYFLQWRNSGKPQTEEE